MTAQPHGRPDPPEARSLTSWPAPTPPIGAELGGELRAARHRAGLSTREAADRIGISAAWLSTLEGGSKAPSRIVAEALVDLLQPGAAVAERLLAATVPARTAEWAEQRAERMRRRVAERQAFKENQAAALAEERARVAALLRTLLEDVEAGQHDDRLAGVRLFARQFMLIAGLRR